MLLLVVYWEWFLRFTQSIYLQTLDVQQSTYLYIYCKVLESRAVHHLSKSSTEEGSSAYYSEPVFIYGTGLTKIYIPRQWVIRT